jgi:hypothetical protein
MLNATPLSPIHATYTAHVILPDLHSNNVWWGERSPQRLIIYGLFNDAVDIRQRSVELRPGSEQWTWEDVEGSGCDPTTGRAADSVFGPRREYFFRAPQQGPAGEGKSKETKQRASYARWPLAANTVNTTNRYLIISDATEATEKDKNIGNIVGTRAHFWTARDWLEQCFSTAGPRADTGPWHQLYRAARGSPEICHFSFLSNFHE